MFCHMNQCVFANSYQLTRYHVRTLESSSTQPRAHQTLQKCHTSLYTRIRENLFYCFKQLRVKKVILPSIKQNIFKPLREEHDYVGARLRPAPLSRCRISVGILLANKHARNIGKSTANRTDWSLCVRACVCNNEKLKNKN